MNKVINKADYQISLDLLRICAILGVLGIHLLYPIFSRPDFLGGKIWWIANIIHSFSLVSVPLFIMASGYLLLGRNYSVKQVFNKSIKRLVIPLIFWSIFYIKWNEIYNFEKTTLVNILGIISSGSIYHLYFLVILIGLYLNLPWLSRWVKHAEEDEKRFGCRLAWIIGIGMYAIYYLKLTSGSVMNLFTWWLPFMGYFLSGYFIKATVDQRIGRKMLGVFLIWWIFTIIMGYVGVEMVKWNFTFFWHKSGLYYFDTFLSPNVIVMSISLFWWLVKGVDLKGLSNNLLLVRSVKTLSKLTFGIYLVHFAVIDWVDIRLRYAIEFIQNNLTAFLFERTLLVVSISLVIALIIRKIPILRRVVGD